MSDTGEQLALVRAEAAQGRARAAKTAPADVLAENLPIARVIVDVEPAHLDRLWDYSVPAKLDEAARPGTRVRVMFAGKQVDGFLWERVERSDFPGALAPLRAVISPEQVLTREIGELARAVADTYVGTLADVLRLAIPPRHARAEKEAAAKQSRSAGAEGDEASAAEGEDAAPDGTGDAVDGPDRPDGSAAQDGPANAQPPAVTGLPPLDPGPWKPYANGPQFLEALAAGSSPRAVWAALPEGPSPEPSDPQHTGREQPAAPAAVPKEPLAQWVHALATTAHATLCGGRGALLIVPDGNDVARLDAGLTALLGPDRHVALTADLGPAERYRRWLAVLRGEIRCVVGTRAAVYAPIRDLGLVAIWDDGDSSHADRVAPYAHAREVLALRAHKAGAGALIGGYAVSAEGAGLVARRWARPIAAPRAAVRERTPLIRTVDPDRDPEREPSAAAARIPALAWRVAKDGLARGPVLIQVPRSGYLPTLACVRCREPAHCAFCKGALSMTGAAAPARCSWCGKPAARWQCGRCGGTRFRARSTGVARSAEEFGRAFPGFPVKLSHGGQLLEHVSAQPALVVATPGAEPAAEGGYAAAVLLDGDLLLGLPTLRAAEQALRRWIGAATLVRPAPKRRGDQDGGVVAIVAEPSSSAVQALVRWDPAGFARRELADRADLGYPPEARIAELTAPYPALMELIDAVKLPDGAQILGPTPTAAAAKGTGEQLQRALIRCSRSAARALAAALKEAQGVRAAHKAPDFVRVRVDPIDLA